MNKVANVLPFKFIGDFPYRAYSGNISVLEGKTLLIGSFIWIIICITFGYLLSKYALKKAVIQGG
jgi:ABC-2 type transport system permease protein